MGILLANHKTVTHDRLVQIKIKIKMIFALVENKSNIDTNTITDTLT